MPGTSPDAAETQLPLHPLRGRAALFSVTGFLIATNLLVFLAMLGSGAGLWHSSNSVQMAWGANFGPATKDGEWWRLGSALFLHFGVLHLGMNMLALWDSGRLVERAYGRGRFLAIYFASGLTGNLLSLIAQGDRAVSGGASGAVFGVYGALLAFLWCQRQRIHPAEFRLLFWGGALFTALMLGFGLVVTGIDNAAHGGGLLGGVLIGFGLMRPAADRIARRRQRIALAAFLLLVTALATNIPQPRYRWSEEQQARKEILEFIGEDARISAQWQAILDQGRAEGASFEDLAGRIEANVANAYEQSFEDLAGLRLSPQAPSAALLDRLRRYAEVRRDASHALAEGLRAHDPARVREALDTARQATRPQTPPASTAPRPP